MARDSRMTPESRPAGAPPDSGGLPHVSVQAAVVAAAAAVPDSTAGTAWKPTERQRRAKTKLLIEMRHDPLLDITKITQEQMAALMHVPMITLHDWKKHPEFLAWVHTKRESEERAQFLLDTFLEQLGLRLPGMGDKDFVQAGKLLLEITHRQSEAAAASTQQAVEDMSPDQLRALVARVYPALGPAAASAAAPDRK